MSKIEVGDRVRINSSGSAYDEMEGQIEGVGKQYDWRVNLDDLKYIRTAGFDSHELDKIKN